MPPITARMDLVRRKPHAECPRKGKTGTGSTGNGFRNCREIRSQPPFAAWPILDKIYDALH